MYADASVSRRSGIRQSEQPEDFGEVIAYTGLGRRASSSITPER